MSKDFPVKESALSKESDASALLNSRTAVARVWAEVLERERIQPDENFFDLGGDSLKALEVISRLQALLNIELPLMAFFEEPTIAHLAQVADELRPKPEPATETSENDQAAQKMQATVARVWSEVLQRENIGLDENFFDLGGDSLKALEVISRLHALFEVELPFLAFFENPSVRHLAAEIEKLKGAQASSPELLATPPSSVPLSFAQLQYWLLHQADPLGSLHTNARVLRIRGEFRADILERALNQICRRHQVLGSRIEQGIEEPMAILDPDPQVKFELQDLGAVPTGARERRAMEVAHEEWHRPFNLSTDLPLRGRLLRLQDDDHVLVLIMHHVVSDGYTGSIFFEELAAIYRALLRGTDDGLPELKFQYWEHAISERQQMQGEKLGREVEFWRSKLLAAPPGMWLPSDRPPSPQAVRSGSTSTVAIAQATLEQAKELARSTGSTLFTVLLGALRILLHRWTGEQDMVIGTVASNRSRAGTERLIGCFVNFLPLRNRVSTEEQAAEVLSREKQVVRDAFAHQDCPFVKMVAATHASRITDASPVYNVGMLLQNFPEIRFTGESFAADLIELESEAALLDLRFIAVERTAGLELTCEFRKDLFDVQTVEHLLSGFTEVLESLLENPNRRISDFTIPAALEAQSVRASKRELPYTLAVTSTFTAQLIEAPLTFWLQQFGWPTQIKFAPYNQVFQQLLDPTSLISRNHEGSNLILVRLTDWLRFEGDRTEAEQKQTLERSVRDFADALTAHQEIPFTCVCLCPPQAKYADDSHWAEFLGQLEQDLADRVRSLSGIVMVRPSELFDLYPMEDYGDEYSDTLGHIPYTQDFFTALATVVMRRILARHSEPKRVIVLDADNQQWKERTLQEFVIRQFEEQGMLVCLCASGSQEELDHTFELYPDMPLRPDYITASKLGRESTRSALRELADELGFDLASFVFLSADSERSREIREQCSEVLACLLPEDSAKLPTYLRNLWVFDARTESIPDVRFSLPNTLLTRIASDLEDIQSIRWALDRAQMHVREPEDAFQPARTPIEELLAGIWAQVLKLDRVGINDNFFVLGGHSLLGTQVVARVRQMFGMELPLRAIFEAPTIAQFAKRIEALRTSEQGRTAPPILRSPDRNHLPLSFAQQRLWFLDQLDPGNPLYNMAQMMRLRGRLDVRSLHRALNQMVRRHEVLRTSFAMYENQPTQVIASKLELPLPVTDLSALDPDRREAEMQRLAREEAERPFDLSSGPLLRAQLLRAGGEDHVLLLVMHHIASDRWTLGLVAEELAEHYKAFTENRPSPLPDLEIQYADFAVWQRNWVQGELLNQQLQYWRKQLAGAPQALGLPTDRPRPAHMSMRGALQSRVLPRDLAHRLNTLSQEEGVTLFMTLVAAFEVLVARYSGQEDVVVGSPIAGRNFAEVEPLIGFFVNTLALRGDLSGDPSFRELLKRTKEVCLQAYASQDIPFEKLVEELQPERSLSRNPIFQVLFALQNAPMQTLELPGLQLERVPLHPGTSILDMSWFTIEVPEGLLVRVEYSTELFEQSTIARALEHFASLLESVTTNPQQPVSQLSLLGESEKQKLLVEFNATQTDFGRGFCIHTLFEQAASRVPNAVAVVCDHQRVSYAELNIRANQIAHYLLKLGVKPDTLVGVFMERRADLLATILGVLKSGAAYVPLDPSYPRDRLAAILEDARASIVLTQESLAGQLGTMPIRVITLEAEWAEIGLESPENPVVPVKPENLAYVLFTSGSTGRPKGVAIEHHSTVTLVEWAQTVYTPEELAGVLLSTSVGFDLSVFEMFVPLSVGGKVIMVQNALFLPLAAAKDEVTLINTVPSAMAELVHMHALPASVKVVNLAGEALPQALVEQIYATTSANKVYNLYGPTEDTTYSTYTLVRPGRAVAIGRPLPNTQAYVLDRDRNLQPIGIPGELYLAGDGLARGYFGREDLTAERFVTNPFHQDNKSQPASRMYRTGDLCRWLMNGELEYLGRMDHQVKLRGFRIELGEIEAVLRKHASVRQSVVVAREDERGQKRLVAYIIPSEPGAADRSALRQHLQQSLPEFMVPSAFVLLDAFPLSPNGKIDRMALPAPEYEVSPEGYSAPRTPIEEVVAGIWAEVLRLPQVGVEDEFFSLGGHSLLATQVISRIRQACRVELPLRALFEAPTVRGLAALIEKFSRSEEFQAPPMVRISRDQPLPLSFAQQRLWFLDQLEPDNAFYNIPQGLRMVGELNGPALENSLTEVIRRHEVLRTTYKMVDGHALQFIAQEPNLKIERVDLGHLPEVQRENEVQRFAADEARRPFQLDQGPVMRAYLVRLTDQEHILILNTHHIASDGWSMALFVRELGELYSALVEGKPSPLPELPIQYADFALWQRNWVQGVTLDRLMDYWCKQLEGAPAMLELPTDRPRPPIQTFSGETRSIRLPIEIRDGLKKLSRSEGATLYMALLAAFQTLLYRYTGQEDIVVGSPIASRNRAEIEDLIGFFVNALAMRTQLSGDPTFRQLLARVREMALDAYAHQDLPFEKLVEEMDPERSLGRNPLFQVLLVLQNAPRLKLDLPGLKLEWLNIYSGTAKFDLALHIAERVDGLNCMMEFNTDLFDGTTMVRMLGHLRTLLEAVVSNPDQRISELPLLTAPERQKLLFEFNHTSIHFTPQHSIHDLVEAQAARTPEQVAVVYENQRLTYRELNERANQLAHWLRKNNVGPETLVGICVERSLQVVIGILGVLKAGGAYVPFDTMYPPERLAFMIEEAKPPVVITQERLKAQLPPHDGRILSMDTDWPVVAEESTENPQNCSKPENLAYVLFTSGSTGKPKGVAIEHRSAVTFVRWAQTVFREEELSGVLFSTSVCFDLSIFELFVPLSVGGKVIVVQNALYLPSAEAKDEVTLINTVPSAMTELVRMNAVPPSVKTINLAGEALSSALATAIYASTAVKKLYNLYGPTEDTTYSTFALVQPGQRITIGRSLPDSQAYVLDANRNLQPIGVSGELYLAGVGLARGYYGRPDLTAERFLPNPFDSNHGRMYRTGDLGRRLPDGNLEYFGRLDHQVKLRGFRIELGEIEAVLAQHAAVRSCVVLVREDAPGNKQLVAYVVPNQRYQGEAEPATNSDFNAALKREQIAQWEMTFDETYLEGWDQDPEFNIVGWNSSYTGKPYPAEHMHEWVDRTVERVRAQRPERVLEIGCGTGLLLQRIAPECQQYVATDFSQRAITRLERIVRERGLSQVSLDARAADNFQGIEPASFDTAVINSVVQYFPSVDYLMTVLEAMIKAVRPGGRIFIGDLRSLPLQEAFHTAVQLQQAPDSLSVEQLAQRIRQRVAQDEELFIDPGLFDELRRREPKIGRVEIQIKRGRHSNEMTQFRYDVVLELAPQPQLALPTAWLDWPTQNLNLEGVRRNLEEAQPELLGLRGVPNARLAEATVALRLLGRKKRPANVQHLKAAIRQDLSSDVEPEDLWELGDVLGYSAEISWSSAGPTGAMDVVFRRKSSDPKTIDAAIGVASSQVAIKPWSLYANNPLFGKVIGNLVPQLHANAAAKLPEYMVPSAFVVLERLPLTENGKVDRRALPAPDRLQPKIEGDYVAPQTPAEELVAAILADVLRLERVGAQDDFFDLGGHSLNATQVVSRVRETFNVELPLRAIFESRTVEALVHAITTLKRRDIASQVPPLARVSREQGLPLSFAQQRLWFLDQMAPANPLYNVPRAIRLTGKLDLKALEVALKQLIARHEILRTTYSLVNDQPVQVIAPYVEFHLPVVDLSGMEKVAREETAQRILREECGNGFHLASDTILRGELLKLNENEHVLFLNTHHIASDGWSSGVMMNDLCAFYDAAIGGKTASLAELTIQYADYASWQRNWLQGEVLERQLTYWKQNLEGAPPVLALPTDRPRPPVQTFAGAMYEGVIEKNLADGLRTLGRKQGTTLFMTLLSAFDSLLYYYTQQPDIVIGTDLANRMSVETEALIGFFVNLLPLRTNLSGDPSFSELTARVREVTLNAYAHQDLPFDKLVEELRPERNLSHSPLVQVLFVQQNTPRSSAMMGGIEMERFPIDVQSKFDMAVFVREVGGEILTSWLYNPDLFNADRMARMAQHFTILLETAVADPKIKLSALADRLARAEKQQRGSEHKKFQEAGLERLKKIRRKAIVEV